MYSIEIPQDKSSDAEVRGVLEERLRAMIERGVEVGGVIIPPENIQIELELDRT